MIKSRVVLLVRALAKFAQSTLTWLDLVFGLTLGLPIWLWSLHRPVQVQAIWTARIGHLACEPALFLARRAETGMPNVKVWFFAEGAVCNALLLEKWRESLPMGPGWLLGPIYRASRRWCWLGLHPLDWPSDAHNDLRPLDGRDLPWGFDDDECARGVSLLLELGVPAGRPYVCLAVRDSAYLAATDRSRNWDHHNYRDSQIADYELMAARLVERGYSVIRMGRIVDREFKVGISAVIDYANSSMRSDFADLWLFANCAFCISTATGMDALATMQGRPLGLVNIGTSASLFIGEVSKLVMFKDLVDVSNGEVLELHDKRRHSAMAFSHVPELAEMGLTFRDNSPGELEAFADEMVDLLEGRWWPTAEHAAHEEKFKSQMLGPLGLDLTLGQFHISPAWMRSRLRVG